MKKILFILLAGLPFLGMAQTKQETIDRETREKEMQMRAAQREAAGRGMEGESTFCDMILADNGIGGIVIKLDFGQEALQDNDDKELAVAIGEARNQKFTNVPDAMSYLSKLGFKYIASYNAGVAGKGETHLLFEKKALKRGGRPSEGTMTKPNETTPPPSKPAPAKPVIEDKKPGVSPSKTDGKSGKK
jgi:hypothetical protein